MTTYATDHDARLARSLHAAELVAIQRARRARAHPRPFVLTPAQRDARAMERATDTGRVLYSLIADQCRQHERLVLNALRRRVAPFTPRNRDFIREVSPDGVVTFVPPPPPELPLGVYSYATGEAQCPYCTEALEAGAQDAVRPATDTTPSGWLAASGYGLGAMIDWDNTAPVDWRVRQTRNSVPAHVAVELLAEPLRGQVWPVIQTCAQHRTRATRAERDLRRAAFGRAGGTHGQRLAAYRDYLLATSHFPVALRDRIARAFAAEQAGDAALLATIAALRPLTHPPAQVVRLYAGAQAVLDALEQDGADVYSNGDD